MKKMLKKKKGTKKTKKMKKGTKYTCRECGLVVTIDEVCGCVDFCDLMCCGKQMAVKTPASK